MILRETYNSLLEKMKAQMALVKKLRFHVELKELGLTHEDVRQIIPALKDSFSCRVLAINEVMKKITVGETGIVINPRCSIITEKVAGIITKTGEVKFFDEIIDI